VACIIALRRKKIKREVLVKWIMTDCLLGILFVDVGRLGKMIIIAKDVKKIIF
jgi:hypothetical protein